jgi:hypothetical protein
MEQLSRVGVGSGGPSRDRVSLYSTEARRDRSADIRGGPSSRKERGKDGATTFKILNNGWASRSNEKRPGCPTLFACSAKG